MTRLPQPREFKASPDSEIIKDHDGVSANYSAIHDRLTIVDNDSGFTIIELRLNGLDPLNIADKYIDVR